MAEKNALWITPLGAARRQLDTASLLYFTFGDEVSIHTLTSAAHEIMAGITDRLAIRPLSLIREFYSYIKPEYQREAHAMVNEAKNFFKHAGRMQKNGIALNPIATEWLLFDAIRLYKHTAGDLTDNAAVFLVWFAMNHPLIFKDQAFKAVLLQAQQKMTSLDRADVYRGFARTGEQPETKAILAWARKRLSPED